MEYDARVGDIETQHPCSNKDPCSDNNIHADINEEQHSYNNDSIAEAKWRNKSQGNDYNINLERQLYAAMC